MKTEKVRIISRRIFWTTAILGLLYLSYHVVAPFGASSTFSLNTGGISDLEPRERVTIHNTPFGKETTVMDDLVYFATDMPRQFDKAKVTITYKNPWVDQDMYIGFRDRNEWHYTSTLIDSPILNAITWPHVGNHPTLFQRTPKYASVKDFLNNPPPTGVLGLYAMSPDNLHTGTYQIPGYTPSSHDSIIDTPLRGKHTLYAYVEKEPFTMTVTKKDLNWYEGPDIMTVDIFKENDLVYHTVFDDDGDDRADRKNLSDQTITIRNPGPGFPETGVYRVVIDATGDTIIRSIRTNLHKVVLDGPVYLASNREVYSTLQATSSGSTIYTDSIFLTAMTPHANATQSLMIKGTTPLTFDAPLVATATLSASTFGPVYSPKGDVIINGIPGFFSTDPDMFFRPFQFNTFQISSQDDLQVVDYVLTDYERPKTFDDWRTAEISIPLSHAVPKDGKLNWIIRLPRLRENERNVVIGSIVVTVTKNSIL